MVTNNLSFAVFAFVVLFPIYFDVIFVFFVIEAGWTFEVFNTDQGSQFTSDAFIEVLKSNDIQISMDGKGRWVDNVMIERLWRSVKYEEVYLKAYSNVFDAKKQLNAYFEFYNLKRPHSSLDKMTRDEFYYD